MKAIKHVLTVTFEVLDIDTIPGLMDRARFQIAGEFTKGDLTASDGDSVKWDYEVKEVEF